MSIKTHLPIKELLQCPKCGADSSTGLAINNNQCRACNTLFFSMGGVPCWFSDGLNQKKVWEATLGDLLAQWDHSNEELEADLSRPDILPSTFERMEKLYQANSVIAANLRERFETAGLSLTVGDDKAINPGIFANFFDLLLRDWAWQTDENNAAFERCMEFIQQSGIADKKDLKILVLGAGAGRLSWDLHLALDTSCTVALDFNPLMLLIAKQLIVDQQGIGLADIRDNPQRAGAVAELLDLIPPQASEEKRNSWYAFGANAWALPFKPESFDLIVTPWFIDVNGKDVRDVIALVDKNLKAGGTWLNHGPLLYSERLPQLKYYTYEDIKQFLYLAGFEWVGENIEGKNYLKSPLQLRVRVEELWTFAVNKPKEQKYISDLNGMPSWLALHHLPIRDLQIPEIPSHPVLDLLKNNIDGNHSINDLAEIIEKELQPDCDCVELVISLICEFFVVT